MQKPRILKSETNCQTLPSKVHSMERCQKKIYDNNKIYKNITGKKLWSEKLMRFIRKIDLLEKYEYNR